MKSAEMRLKGRIIMDNNFDKKKIENENVNIPENDSAEAPKTEAAQTESQNTAGGVTPPYFNNLAGRENQRSEIRVNPETPSVNRPQNTPPAHPYYNATQNMGNISYMPTDGDRQKKSGRGGFTAVLVVAGLLLSTACGMFGAYVSNEYFGDFGSGGGAISSDTTVVYRNVDSVEKTVSGDSLTYSEVEKLAGDSVVAITTEYVNVGLWQYVTSGAGSGVVMSEDGYIITNNHVVCRSDNTSRYADKIMVTLKNGEEYEASVIGGDAEADIAVIKIDKGGLTPTVFADSASLAVGEEVMAIGNPLGELSGTATNGIISALAREINVDGTTMNLLQTNAAINPGNSGGGLFNMKGELVGIVNAKSSGTGIEGLGFAIPSNDALKVATDLIESGGTSSNATVMIGIETTTINNAAAAQRYGFSALGVYVSKVKEGYNDDVLEEGDRIIAVNGEEIIDGKDIVSIVRSSEAGDVLEFALYRDGRLMTVEVKCFAADGSNGVDFGE